jgi:hypothetical protein
VRDRGKKNVEKSVHLPLWICWGFAPTSGISVDAKLLIEVVVATDLLFLAFKYKNLMYDEIFKQKPQRLYTFFILNETREK